MRVKQLLAVDILFRLPNSALMAALAKGVPSQSVRPQENQLRLLLRVVLLRDAAGACVHAWWTVPALHAV